MTRSLTAIFAHPVRRRGAGITRALLCVTALLTPSTARAQDLILDAQGTIERGTILTFDHRRLTWRDPAGAVRELPRAACVALTTSVRPQRPPDAPGTMVMTDGQTLPGRIGLVSDTLIWRHTSLDEVMIDLERLRSLVLVPGVEPPPATDADVVVLTNGDRVSGVITGLGSTVHVEGLDGGVGASLPIERVAALSLVNPPRPLGGATAWLADGSIVRVSDPRLEDDGLVRFNAHDLGIGDAWLLVPFDAIAGILFRPDMLVPLADLQPAALTAPPWRLSVPPPRRRGTWAAAGLVPVELSGPVAVTFQLPAEGMRFLARAELPESARHWGDLEIVLRSGDHELARHALDGASPQAEIAVEVTGDSLTIELLEGGNGPIQDTVILHRPLLLRAGTT